MQFTVYSRRWGHNDTYEIARAETGWRVQHITTGGDCDKQGRPYLFNNLDHDSINYPASLGEYMEFLWEKVDEDSLSDAQIQQHLNQLANWVQGVEQSTPEGIWDQLK